MRSAAYAKGELKAYKYVVIFARYRGQWIFCKHRLRDTFETSGGHIEPGETPEQAARRELYEETGAADFTLSWIFDYWAVDERHEVMDPKEANGAVFLADVSRLSELPESEMEYIALVDKPPEKLTYPDIMAVIFPIAEGYMKEYEKQQRFV